MIETLFHTYEQAIITPENKLVLEKVNRILSTNQKLRNETKYCPVCNSNIEDRKITLFQELIDALYKVYCWCGAHKKHEFETKEITHLLNKNTYARFGDLVRFGGIVYKPKDDDGNTNKAVFGINMKRMREFLHEQREIPVQITLNQITGEIIDAKYVKINDFPKLVELLNTKGLYDHEKEL